MLIVLIVFLQSFLFSLFHLHIRRLEEKGVSAYSIAGLQRYTIIPAIILFVATYKKEYVSIILSHPLALWWIVGIGFFWSIGQYVGYIVLDSASSLSFVYTMSAFLEIPILLTTSMLINHDYPNPSILIAIILLVVALIIKPTQHTENKRHLFKYNILIVVGLVFTSQIGHALDGAFCKNLLHFLAPSAILFGILIYIFITSLVLNIIYSLPIFKKPSSEEKKIIKKYFRIAYLVPCIWFIASLPEGYGFAHLPLFTLSALGSFSFLINFLSDGILAANLCYRIFASKCFHYNHDFLFGRKQSSRLTTYFFDEVFCGLFMFCFHTYFFNDD